MPTTFMSGYTTIVFNNNIYTLNLAETNLQLLGDKHKEMTNRKQAIWGQLINDKHKINYNALKCIANDD